MASRNWQKVSHPGSPADKRCDILTTAILICYCHNANCYLAYTVAIFLLFYFLLPFFPTLATTRRVRLKEFKHHFWLYIYIMLNLTANSNVVGNIVQGLRINKKNFFRSKRFEKQVVRTCPKNSNWFEFVGLVTWTKVWSLSLDFEAKMTSPHNGTCPGNL